MIYVILGHQNCKRFHSFASIPFDLKRFIAISLTFFYFVASVGATVNFHYCHGELVDFELFGEAESCCEKACNTGCCSDLTIQIDFDDDHNTNADLLLPSASMKMLPVLMSMVTDQIEQEPIVFNDTEGPPLERRPLYLLFSQLVTYG